MVVCFILSPLLKVESPGANDYQNPKLSSQHILRLSCIGLTNITLINQCIQNKTKILRNVQVPHNERQWYLKVVFFTVVDATCIKTHSHPK